MRARFRSVAAGGRAGRIVRQADVDDCGAGVGQGTIAARRSWRRTAARGDGAAVEHSSGKD
ncbi:MAG: hypothetical protein ACTHMJ_15900 [Thermomicrobiales bacterium]